MGIVSIKSSIAVAVHSRHRITRCYAFFNLFPFPLHRPSETHRSHVRPSSEIVERSASHELAILKHGVRGTRQGRQSQTSSSSVLSKSSKFPLTAWKGCNKWQSQAVKCCMCTIIRLFANFVENLRRHSSISHLSPTFSGYAARIGGISRLPDVNILKFENSTIFVSFLVLRNAD